jgi:phosphoenolpyruvate synthase/pyruvate phosphate dikinase
MRHQCFREPEREGSHDRMIIREHEFDYLDEQRCTTIRSQIIQAAISQELTNAIRAAHHQLVQQRGSPIVCAVRSSATAEDLQKASFAGSYLSHAGTVAREYGMPCVVDVAECTKRIQTGARRHVDGDRGIVRIL